MRGLLSKTVHETWVATLLFGCGLFAVMALLTYVVPQFHEGMSELFEHLPFVKTLLAAMLGTEVGDEINARTMQALEQSVDDAPEQREAKEIDALIAITNAVGSSGSDPDFFLKVMEHLKNTVAYADGTIFLHDAEVERLEPIATVGKQVDLIGSVEFDMGLGLSAWVAKKKKPILISELARGIKDDGPLISSFLSVPVVVRGEMIGVVNVSHPSPRAFNEDDLRFVRLFAQAVSAPLVSLVSRRERERRSVCDRLTGVYNRGHFQERLRGELDHARRLYQPLSLLFVDVDNFAAFNDRFGNAAGDKALVEISKVLQRWSRSTDIVSRYGGEEFVILMPRTSREEASKAAERLRKQIETHSFPQKRRVTISLGAAAYPEDADNDVDLVAKAEQALYMAKKAGRNRTVNFHALAVH